MRQAAVVLALASAAGCGENGADPMPAEDTGTTITVPPQTKRDSDDGAVVVAITEPWLGAPVGSTVLTALFVDDDGGILNLPQCAGPGTTFCITELPVDPKVSVAVQAFDPAFVTALDTRAVGDMVQVGPWSAALSVESTTSFSSYQQIWDVPAPTEGSLGAVFEGGDGWGPRTADASGNVDAPTPMALTSHDPHRVAQLYDVDTVALRWDPGSVGDVMLLVDTPLERRLHLLEDDGAHDLDLTTFGLVDDAEVQLTLGRWSTATSAVGDHTLFTQVQHNQPLNARWNNIGQRDDLTGGFHDNCSDAAAAPGVPSGHYFGSFPTFLNELDPGADGCTGGAAEGPDALVPVDVLPNNELTVGYSLVDDDEVLYLVTDCSDAATCLTGSDGTGEEFITWRNDTLLPQRVYVALDSSGAVSGEFRLDLDLTAADGDILVNTCSEAIAQGSVAPGNYGGQLADHLNLLDPKCAASAAAGEGMVQVVLASGETLQATATTPGATATLYLMSNCAIADSCFFAAFGPSLSYTNDSPYERTIVLVVDSELGLGSYFLDIEIQ